MFNSNFLFPVIFYPAKTSRLLKKKFYTFLSSQNGKTFHRKFFPRKHLFPQYFLCQTLSHKAFVLKIFFTKNCFPEIVFLWNLFQQIYFHRTILHRLFLTQKWHQHGLHKSTFFLMSATKFTFLSQCPPLVIHWWC